MAADRTVLSSDYITDTMDEEGVYADLTTEYRDEVSGEVSSATDGLDLPQGIDISGLDGDTIAEQTVTEEYVRQEVTKNIDRLYEFLHGEQDDVEFVVDIRPVKDSISTAIVEGTVIDTPTFVGESTDRIDTDTVAALEESQGSYQDTQEQFEVSSSEADVLKSEAESTASQMNNPESVTNAAVEIQFTVIDALAGELTYDEYTSQLESNEQALKEAIATEGLAGVDDQIQLGNEDEDPADTFDTAATAVQWLSTFTWLLPLVSLVLIVIIAAITRTFDGTAMPTGIAVLLAGGIGAIISFGLSGTVLSRVEEAATDGDTADTGAFIDGLLSAIDGVLQTLGTQSILLAVLGLILVGLAFADRNSHLDGVRETVGLEREPSPAPRPQGQTRQQTAGAQGGGQPPGQQPAGQRPVQQQPGNGQPGQEAPGSQPGQEPAGGQPGQQAPDQQPPGEPDQQPPGQEPGVTDDVAGPPRDETAGPADDDSTPPTDDETGPIGDESRDTADDVTAHEDSSESTDEGETGSEPVSDDDDEPDW